MKKFLILVMVFLLPFVAKAQPAGWNRTVTPNNMLIALETNISPTLDGQAMPSSGVYIGFFYTDNGLEKCAGYLEWKGSNDAIMVYGDDSFTASKDGFSTYEALRLKLAYNGTIIENVDFALSGDGLFRSNDMIAFTKLNATTCSAPTTTNDEFVTPQNTALSIDVLNNDVSNGCAINVSSLAIVNSPMHGTCLINNGKILYTPTSGYTGTDGFTYTVKNSSGTISAPATVSITINAAAVSSNKVNLRIYSPDNCSHLQCIFSPAIDITTLCNAVFTIRYPKTIGLLNFSSNYFFVPDGSPVLVGNYYYQKVATASTFNVNWKKGLDYCVISFEHNQAGTGDGVIEIVNDTWTTANNGDFYVEQFGIPQDITGNISGGSASINLGTCFVTTTINLMLQGAYSSALGIMRNALANKAYIPSKQPYTAIYSGTESFASVPADAIDWVLVELLDNSNVVVERRAAILLKDNSLLDPIDNKRGLKFFSAKQGVSYFIRIQHRNHFPIITSTAIPFGLNSTCDFTSGNNVKGEILLDNGQWAMIAGNLNNDSFLKISGASNDRSTIIAKNYTVFGTTTTLSDIAKGYYIEDTNLDGEVKFVGASNDALLLASNLIQLTGSQMYTAVYTHPVVVNSSKSLKLSSQLLRVALEEDDFYYYVRAVAQEAIDKLGIENIELALKSDSKLSFVSDFDLEYQSTEAGISRFAMVSYKEITSLEKGKAITLLTVAKTGKPIELKNFYISAYGSQVSAENLTSSIQGKELKDVIVNNPVKNACLQISLPCLGNYTLELFSVLGQSILNQSLTAISNPLRIEIPAHLKGIFFLRITDSNHQILNKKILVE